MTQKRLAARAVRFPVASLACIVLLAAFVLPARAAKNAILMIADGGGFNAWTATSMYQGKLGKQVYEGPEWIKLAACTYPLNQSTKPKGTGVQDPKLVYDPAKAWNAAAEIETPPKPDLEDKETDALAPKTPLKTFAGYIYLKRTATDSAAAGSAMATGVKTYNNAVNWTDKDESLEGRTIAELAKAAGKGVGVVTSVQWAHATPACLGGAHNVTRRDYAGIAAEMLAARWLDVIVGAGDPEFRDDGLPNALRPDYRWVGGAEAWSQLKQGTHPGAWKPLRSKADFESLLSGPTPSKVLGTAQVATTLQQKRSKVPPVPPGTPSPYKPFDAPPNPNVPSLATMTRAALNCLDDRPQGFFLMVEGGAVDWACHANQAHRVVEEQSDFLAAVEAVVAWVEKHGGWDDTLLILTADHETGLLWGPNSDRVPFEPLEDNGAGKMPGLRFNSGAHTNGLVPLYARGAGSEQFLKHRAGTDATAAAKWGFSGQYVENTSIFRVMQAAIGAAEPAGR